MSSRVKAIYIEYVDGNGAVQRVPTTLPINESPTDSTTITDSDSAVLVVTHRYLVRCGQSLQALNIQPARRLRYEGQGSDTEPGLGFLEFTTMGAGFSELQSIEFCGVENIRQIRNDFLSSCSSLTTIDLTPFRNVTFIKRSFLRGCNFTSLDLSPLSNVTDVDVCFLFECCCLTTLDLSPLSKVKLLPSAMVRCTSLTSINLSALTNMSSTGCQFLRGCCSLTTVDVSAFNNSLTSVGDNFMSQCTALESIDLTPFRKFTSIPSLFLSNGGLPSIDLGPLSNVTTIGDHFIAGQSSITAIDLTPLSGVTKIGSHFMGYLLSLTAIDLTPLSNVVTIGPFFMHDCTALKKIDLSPLVTGRLISIIDKTFMKKTKGLSAPKRRQFVSMMDEKINGTVSNNAATNTTTAVGVVTERKVNVKVAGKKKK